MSGIALNSYDVSAINITVQADAQELMRTDDGLLRGTFFSILRHHHPELAGKVDAIYAESQAWCSSESKEDFDILQKELSALTPDERILV